jgi:hypothetical protein
MLTLVAMAAVSHTYKHLVGYIGRGGDVLPVRATTLQEAEALCSATPTCKGITFEADEPAPTGQIPKVYFKGHSDMIAESTWQTYLRDYVPPPPMLQNPCINASLPQAAQPWCNATLPTSVRIADMIGRMSVAEKISQLVSSSAAVPSLGLPAYDCALRPHTARTARAARAARAGHAASLANFHVTACHAALLTRHWQGGMRRRTAWRAATTARTWCRRPTSPSPSRPAWPSTGRSGATRAARSASKRALP